LIIKDIKCGSNHSIALTKSGEINGWGWNWWRQCGDGHIHEFNLIPIKFECSGRSENFIDIMWFRTFDGTLDKRNSLQLG
jgi:alpha-tubulin suppressor-like RCC1 family protein